MKQHVNGFDRSAKNITEEAKELGRKAYNKTKEEAGSLKKSSKEMVEPVLESAKVYADKVGETSEKAKKYAAENPYKTAFAAVSLVALFSWIFFRRKR